MSKKSIIALITLLLCLFSSVACALSVTPVDAENYRTIFEVTGTHQLLYEGGIRYDADSPQTDRMLVPYDGKCYVVNLISGSSEGFRHEKWHLEEDELLPPIILDDCEKPMIEEITIHRFWRDNETGADAGETFEYMYRLTLPPHNINLNK